jgi:hypothetical protein
MIWAVGREDEIGIVCFPQWLGARVSQTNGVLLAQVFGAGGSMAAVRGRLVAEIAGTAHGPFVLSFLGFHCHGDSNLPAVVIAHCW